MLSEAEFESNEFTDGTTASGHRYIGGNAVVVSLGQLWLSEDASILCGARLRKPLWWVVRPHGLVLLRVTIRAVP